jgi:hypothetical protein
LKEQVVNARRRSKIRKTVAQRLSTLGTEPTIQRSSAGAEITQRLLSEGEFHHETPLV